VVEPLKIGRFALAEQAIALPRGAIARGHRRMLLHDGRPLLGLTQARFRPCLFPLFTPAGYAVTQESPADHPHHNSLWIAADHVHLHVPGPGSTTELYAYNFYVDETFQGRAPGRILETALAAARHGGDGIALTQAIDWRGPSEWGAPDGRLVLRETRITTVTPAPGAVLIDIESRLSPTEWEVTLGPTRHAFFNVRVADSLLHGLAVTDDRGDGASRLPWIAGAAWIDLSGPVGGGAVAGVAVMPAASGACWFVTDWGVATVGQWRETAVRLAPGGMVSQRCRFVVHDGPAVPAALAAWHRAMPVQGGP
jgi:hypothetical protein